MTDDAPDTSPDTGQKPDPAKLLSTAPGEPSDLDTVAADGADKGPLSQTDDDKAGPNS